MKRSGLALIAASSVLWCAAAGAATRPHYGGTLRIAMSAAPASLDALEQPDSLATRNLSRLLFDTLVELDERGIAQPALAVSWESEPSRQRWQFHLRSGLTFDDGTPLTPEAVAASLRAANANWTVSATENGVIVVRDSAAPSLPAELALPRNCIAKRGGGKIHGTGPFTVTQWDPGKRVVLAAREDYWRGRPFASSIEVDLGKGLREQMILLDLGKLDVIEVAAEQARQVADENRSVQSSVPMELMALVFARERQSVEDGRWRQALALSVDRGSLSTVLLQGGGEPAGGLLPAVITGYSFVFPVSVDLDRARAIRNGLRPPAQWTLGYAAADPLARVVAERVALNARDAGLPVQPVGSGAAEVRLVRVPLASLDARTALAALASCLGLDQPKVAGDSMEDLYAAESLLLQTQRVIPLLHLRTSFAAASHVKNRTAAQDGSWNLEDMWLEDKP